MLDCRGNLIGKVTNTKSNKISTKILTHSGGNGDAAKKEIFFW